MLKTLIFNSLLSKTISLRQYIGIRNMSCKRALVLLAPGAEEMEFVIAADVLARGGIQVTTCGVPNGNMVTCSRGINIQPDIGIAEACRCGSFDAVVLPGGLGGAKILAESKEVGCLLRDFEVNRKIIAAICAAPKALLAHGVALGRTITSYPSVRSELELFYRYVEDRNVVVDGNYITSRGPGTAYEFAMSIVEKLVGKRKTSGVAKDLLLSPISF